MKPLEAFTKDKRKPGGYSVRCKTCHNELTRAWRANNPEYLRQYYLTHRAGTPRPVIRNGAKPCSNCRRSKPLAEFHLQADGLGGRRSVCKLCRHNQHRADPEPTRERARRVRERSPEYMRLWRRQNRNRLAEHFLRYKLRLTGQTYGHSVEYMATVATELRTQPCTYCHGPGGEVDHIVPLAKGGPHHPDNLAASCRSCNSSKGDRLLHEWNGPPALRLAA